MRLVYAALPLLASLAAGCGPRALALPDDPIQRAATCGVVAAADARKSGGGAVSQPLTIQQAAKVLHYPMLAAAESGTFDTERAGQVVDAMPGVEGGVTEGKWDALIAPCDAAYPAAAAATPAALPSDPLDPLGCSALGEFLSKSFAKQDAAYGDQLFDYRNLATGLDGRVASRLRARGVDGFDETKAARDKALAGVVKLGPPVAVMDQCLAKYGEKA